jgi:hypothetical protein
MSLGKIVKIKIKFFSLKQNIRMIKLPEQVLHAHFLGLLGADFASQMLKGLDRGRAILGINLFYFLLLIYFI